MNLFRTKTLDIDVRSHNTLLISIYKHTLANKINKHLGQYGREIIKKGEEPMFRVDASEWAKIKNDLPLPSTTVQRIENFFKNGL